MKILLARSFILLAFMHACWCEDLVLGRSHDARLVWQQKVDYVAVPFIKRVKNLFYVNPDNEIIKGIVIRDLEQSDSTVSITAGGLGLTYANIRLKSKRGESLNYQMEIYV